MASTSTSTTQSKDTKAKAPATRKDTKAAPTHDQPQAPTSEQVDAVRDRRRLGRVYVELLEERRRQLED